MLFILLLLHVNFLLVDAVYLLSKINVGNLIYFPRLSLDNHASCADFDGISINLNKYDDTLDIDRLLINF